MTARDREAALTADALVYRLRNRGDGDGQFATDDEVFAQEWVAAMLGRGWRPVEVLAPWDRRNQPAGDGSVSEEARRELDEARRALTEAAERLRAREAGDAA